MGETPRPYLDQLRAELNEIGSELDRLLDHSAIGLEASTRSERRH